MVIAEDSKLKRVMPWIALVVPTATEEKLTEETDKADAGSPVPRRAIASGLLVALEVTVKELAGTAPNAVGVRVTAILQKLPSAATGVEVEQVVEGSSA
jgi:hypothetical protein